MLIPALYTLLNIAYDPTNYPAFFFACTIREVIPYLEIDHFDVSSTAKFLLSCLHQHLDCHQLKLLKLKKSELEFCMTSLKRAVSSADLQAEGFSVTEILQILANFTHPSHCIEVSLPTIQIDESKKKQRVVVPSMFAQMIREASEQLLQNCFGLYQLQIIPVLLECLRDDRPKSFACTILWNLIHHKEITEKVRTNYSDICRLVSDMDTSSKSNDQLLSQCCLFLMGERNIEG